ncbi:MAG: class I SAM-dependent methyltransferase [Candidatus Bathyarchaeia archaeon]
MGVSSSSPYKEFMRRWMLEKYGWKNETGFAAGLRGRQLILDAGAGLGREVINLATAAPEATVVGLEFSDCAANALRNVSHLQNACIIQGDIMRMPFAENSFDYILSEGVLHHTPKTQEAFKKCCGVLKKRGEIVFYVYRKKGPIREYADDFLRKAIQDMSVEEQWKMAERITSLGKSLSEAHTAVEISEGIPELGIKKGKIDVQRFIYYSFLKCFWTQELPFEENVIINFDWYVPRHAQRHTEEEIREWCKENSIEIVWFHEEESGYSVRGIRS